jgi:hypothetical protein
MPNAAGGSASIQAGRNDSYRSIVSDLASLIEHVQASVRLIESAIASEAPLGNQEMPATSSYWTTSRLAT